VLLALIGLLVVAAAWGSSFPLTKSLLHRTTALNFLAVRFAIAGLIMLVLFHRAVRALPRRALLHGGILGVTYGVAQIVQTTGLAHTSASVSGFITGMYVVLTPICAAVLLKSAISTRVWIGAAVATVGLAILALTGFSMGFGEAVRCSRHSSTPCTSSVWAVGRRPVPRWAWRWCKSSPPVSSAWWPRPLPILAA